jgi:hypothetical protein
VLVVARKRPQSSMGTAAAAAVARSTPIHGRGGGGGDDGGRGSAEDSGRDVTDGPQPGPQAHPGVRLSHTRQIAINIQRHLAAGS